jgi:hypothetical protein
MQARTIPTRDPGLHPPRKRPNRFFCGTQKAEGLKLLAFSFTLSAFFRA